MYVLVMRKVAHQFMLDRGDCIGLSVGELVVNIWLQGFAEYIPCDTHDPNFFGLFLSLIK